MKEDAGAPQADGLGNAEASEPSGLGASPAIPRAVYVIARSTGEYSDRREEPVCAVTDEATAKYLVVVAEQEWRSAVAVNPRVPWPDNAVNEGDYEAHERACEARLERVRASLTVDPGSADDYDEEPYYFYNRVPLYASATRSDATTQIGAAEGESAASEAGDAPA